MDITTFIGIVVAGGLVVSAILMGGPGAWFINPPSMMIVIGGTMGATFVNYPLSEVMGVFRVVKNVFLHKVQSADEVITLIVDLAKKARREGLLSFESKLEEMEDPFMVKGLELAIDGVESNAIEEIMNTEIEYIQQRHSLGAEIFTTMGTFAPAVGMLGTIIGLVQMLMQMEDPSQIGKPMSVALLTTFYGVLLANLLFLPIAGKLRTRSRKEVLMKQLVLEGIISIQSGDNHRVVEQKLKAFIPPKERQFSTEGEASEGKEE